jgi:hypothetical protein
LHVVVDIPAGTLVSFSFEVTNPLCGQVSQPVCIRAKSFCAGDQCQHKELVIPRRLMEHDMAKSNINTCAATQQGYAEPMMVLKPEITKATLTHSSPWANSDNTLKMIFTTNVHLFTRVKPTITIEFSNQHYSQTPAGQVAVTVKEVGGDDVGTYNAEWDPATGKLAIPLDTVAKDFEPCKDYEFTWILKNRQCQNAAPTATVGITSEAQCTLARNMWTDPANPDAGMCFDTKQITAVPLTSCSVQSDPLQVIGGSCDAGGATDATFTVKTISQSSCLPGCVNTVTIAIKANVPIPAHATQKIDIQFGNLVSQPCIVGYGVVPHFEETWSQNMLSLEVVLDLDACVEYTITFDVTNDVAAHSFASPAISASGTVIIPSANMVLEADACDKPFEVSAPTFLVTNIGQSNPYPGFLTNTLCVTISTNTFMDQGHLAIYGLDKALAVDGDIELTGTSASKFESDAGTSSHGTWNNCEKALLLTVASDLGFCAEAELEFCFQVANPIEPQLCADVVVNVTKIPTCKAVDYAMTKVMTGDEATSLHETITGAFEGDACPMVIWPAAFCVKDIFQSTDLPCDTNTIAITLSANVPLKNTFTYPAELYMAN